MFITVDGHMPPRFRVTDQDHGEESLSEQCACIRSAYLREASMDYLQP